MFWFSSNVIRINKLYCNCFYIHLCGYLSFSIYKCVCVSKHWLDLLMNFRICWLYTPVWGIWEMWSTLSLALLPGQLWLRVVVSVRVPSVGQIDLFKNYQWDRNTWYPSWFEKNLLKSKLVSDHSRGWPEGSLFDSYYTKV